MTPPEAAHMKPFSEQYQRLLSVMPALVFELTPGGKILTINDAAEAITGYTIPELIGQNFWELLIPDPDCQLKEKLVGEDVSDWELLLRRRDGALIVLSLTTANIWAPDEMGQHRLEQIIGLAIKGKSQKQTIEQYSSEDRILDELPVLAWRSGRQGEGKFFNQRWLEFTGKSLEQELGSGWLEAVHPEDRPLVAQSLAERIEMSKPIKMEYRLRKRDDTYRWMMNIGRPITDGNGDFAGYLCTCHDINDYKRTVEALRESEARYRLMVSMVRDYAIIRLDPHGNVITWNAGAQAIKGYTASEIIGKNFSLFHPQAARDSNHPQRLLMLAARDGHYEEEGWRVRKDGSCFWASVVISSVRDEAGQLVGFTKVVRDISQRKQAEEALRRQTEFVQLLQDIAVAANEAYTVENALRYALHRICLHTKWKLGLAYLVDEESGELYSTGIAYMTDWDRFKSVVEAIEGMRFGPGEGLLGQVLLTRGPQWTEDIYTSPHFKRTALVDSAVLKTEMALPILVGKQVAGVLEFLTDEIVSRDDDLIQVMSHIGAQLGRVIERQRSENALRASEMRFRTLFDDAPLGIEMIDLNGHILEVNPAVDEMLGYNIKELDDITGIDANHPANFIADINQIEKMRKEARTTYKDERPLRRSDGSWIWGRLLISLVRDQLDRPQYIIGMLEDISDRKQMETDLAELQRRLMEGREAERLHLAQELHDGPLQDLYGLSFNLKAFAQGLQPDYDQHDLDDIQSSLHHVVRTLRHVSGELRPPTLEPFGLEKAIQSHAEVFKEMNDNLDMELDLAADGQTLPGTIRLVLFRVYQQAMNNVARHAHANKVRVRLILDQGNVILEVQDNGVGFQPPSNWIEIVRQGQLGLANASERVEAIGGRLEVQATPGGGTLLRVTVPHTGRQKLALSDRA